MPPPTEKIATALENAKKVSNKNIVKSSDLNRTDRELLVRTHWLQEIIKGWYILTRPDVSPGDSTAWYANFWDYLSIYLNARFAKDYCLSAETSLELQIGSNTIPEQVIVIVHQGGVVQNLPFSTSIMAYADPDKIPDEIVMLNDLQVMSLALALCKVSPTYFQRYPENAEIALRSIRSTTEISQCLLKYNFQRAAERIIGAYQFLQMNEQAQVIINDIAFAGIKITPSNPFQQQPTFLKDKQFRSPYAARIEVLWHKHRSAVLENFPTPPELPNDAKEYLKHVNDLYECDAYNSLSIEGYSVSEDLIAKVKANDWNPDSMPKDAEIKNALAARGYYEAFQNVKAALEEILAGNPPGVCITKNLNRWYQNLFAPAVHANIPVANDI